MESFSAELHSSASSKLYPQNTIASLTIFLPDQINLEGEEEVTLNEICFPSKFFNIREGSFGISVAKGGKFVDSEIYKLSPGYYPTRKSIVSSMFAKIFAGSRFRNLHKMEPKFLDFSVDTISQRIFIKTMPGLKIFLGSGDLHYVFVFMPSNETLEIDDNLSTAPFVHDFQRFHALIFYTIFIANTSLGDVKAPVLKRFPIDKPHFKTTQRLTSKSFHNLVFRRVLKHSFHSKSIDLRSQNGELIPFFSLGYTHLSILFRSMQ